ncbi:DNA replication protein [Puccinia graminis f. sp. tritici]|uniref:DNA replication complex GINS protein PSF3 n=1 Tax=Puccinia graminis f. sp. tritici TaxID=56615 RepID=A0A5B0NWL7_PUCGR|nr:DNA replication protein [Puccinia graminis f. sp. tritici]
MDDAYYSLDQLLAENQKIPCIFNIAVPGMGYLEGTNERDIQPYTPIEIPFWLASILSQQDNPEDESQNYLTIQIPKAFNLQIRNALSASTKNVNLKNLAANSGGGWYESGMALLDISQTKDSITQDIIRSTTRHNGSSLAPAAQFRGR